MLRSTCLALASLALALCTGGCARTTIVDPQETTYDPNDVTAQLDFWHELNGRSAITNNEGVHGVILMTQGTDETGSWEARLDFLDERGWLPDSLRDESPDTAMQRGTLAAILVRAMNIDGGVMMRLTDKAPRYAYREMVYLGLMPEGSEQMVLDGLDYLGVISESEDFLALRARREAQEQREAEENDAPAGDA